MRGEPNVAKRLLIVLPLSCVIAAGAVLALFPKIITGDFCDVTFTQLDVAADGHVEFTYLTRTSSGTNKFGRFSVDGVIQAEGGGGSSGFPAWPSSGSSSGSFSLDPDRVGLDNATLWARLRVQRQVTYTVRRNQPVILYRFTSESGHAHEGRIEIE